VNNRPQRPLPSRALGAASALLVALALAASVGAEPVAIDWTDRFDGPDHLPDVGSVVVAGPEGSVYVAGSSAEWFDPTLVTTSRVLMRIAADGTRLWERRDVIGFAGSSTANLAVDSAGDLLVLTTEEPFSGIVVDKISSAGVLLWSQAFAPPAGSFARAEGIAAGPGDSVHATWFEYNLGDVGAVARLSSTGVVEWTRRYAGPGGGAEPAALAVDATGASYVAGSATVGDSADFALWKYSAAGDFEWVRTEGSPLSFANDRAVDLAVDGAGVVIAGTWAQGSGLGTDFAVVRIDASGQTAWLSTSRNPAGSSDWAYGMTVASDGQIYVAGASEIAPNHLAPVVAAFDAAGVPLWARSFDGGVVANGYFFDVASDAAGRPYAAGYDNSVAEGSTIFVAALGVNGEPRWTSRHAPVAGQPSEAAALALTGDDAVVVCGSTWYRPPAGGFDRDLVTIRYRSSTLLAAGFEAGDTAEWSSVVE
jgi:hypothetical protein